VTYSKEVINLCVDLEEGGLSKVDAWRLLNVIFRLYKVIASCHDLCNLYLDKRVLLPEKWMDKDREMASYYRRPQRYEYGTEVKIKLSGRTFEKLHDFIIEQDDFALAMDFVQPEIHLNHLIRTMKKVEKYPGMRFSSLGFMVLLRNFRAEIYKWAAVYSSRINSSIEREMAKRQITTYALLCDALNRGITLREETGEYALSDKNTFNLSDFFIDGYDRQRIIRIFQYMNSLNLQQDESYIAKMASIIAIAWERHLLCETYSKTLQAVFDHYGITDKVENYKPSRFRRLNYKGNPPLARVQALKLFQSMENNPFFVS